jgi:hypothetical protein
MRFSLTLSALALATALAAPASAEPSLVRQAQLSAELYALGLEARDPVTILTAAKLRKQMSFTRDDSKGFTAPGDVAGVTKQAAPVTWQEMLAEARDFAAGDAAVLGLIEDLENEAGKGVATGQVYSISTIRDGGTDTYDPLPFRGGEYAEVYVESRDGSDLNVYIYDAQGRLVCSDTDISAISYCGWRPADSGSFTIEVKNRGQGGAGYSLMTN